MSASGAKASTSLGHWLRWNIFLSTATLRGVALLAGPGRSTANRESAGMRFSDRGAILVEMAFALPLLIMLIVGMVSAGIAYHHPLALTHAAREGGRLAATLPVANFGSLNLWLDEVATRVVEDATGSLDPGAPGLVVCVAYVHPSGGIPTDQTANRIDNGGMVTNNPAACFADGRPADERRVQVAVARETDFNVVFFSSTLTIDSEAVNRFEAAGGL